MLTIEDRQRIEEEERKRIAEEQYRQEVRAKLQSGHTVAKQPRGIPWVGLSVGAVIVIATVAVLMNSRGQSKIGDDSGAAPKTTASNPAPLPKTRYVPVSQHIATGQIIVKANGYVRYRITITPEMVQPTVTGNFNASGGSGNDIQAVIADEDNYTNWINGHQSDVFWGTPGKQTTGNIEVTLRPGTYYLAFSNRFSRFSDKQVFLEVDLNYKKAETYY